jgi:GNAT superfamily N-acetyltransferase
MEYRLRDAQIFDAPALAELHVRTFRETHGGGPSVATRTTQWSEILARSNGPSFCIILESSGGEMIGFARGVVHQDTSSGFEGELNKIYLLREYHRRGLGKLLLCAAARRFLTHGIGSMLLFGDAFNPSNGFYEVMGAERLYSDSGEFHGGYGWRDLHTLAALCESER